MKLERCYVHPQGKPSNFRAQRLRICFMNDTPSSRIHLHHIHLDAHKGRKVGILALNRAIRCVYLVPTLWTYIEKWVFMIFYTSLGLTTQIGCFKSPPFSQ
jgi:hypothetical protein